ncbi:hypothetical protein DVH24_009735 [Malus domestica]|uniref:Uncharacterized protein n=1 Tax=Malus domestica TaxID=3750 RepID=A0A498JSL5_MALDO|nr:hypothetical protein DVH24_009735 [Malus domestica]
MGQPVPQFLGAPNIGRNSVPSRPVPRTKQFLTDLVPVLVIVFAGDNGSDVDQVGVTSQSRGASLTSVDNGKAPVVESRDASC